MDTDYNELWDEWDDMVAHSAERWERSMGEPLTKAEEEDLAYALRAKQPPLLRPRAE